MENRNELFYNIQRHVAESFEGIQIDSNKLKKNVTSEVDYDQLLKELKRGIYLTKNDIYFDDTFHSLYILGDTGLGKTEIIKQIAEEEGAVYHKLEIQKVPIEELQGFPYLYKTKDGKTVVRLAHPTDLPPSDDTRLWVFHLDEFNKADTEDMAAVMNLVLNGEIGGSADYNEETGESEKYRLPKRTFIVGSGNPKTQQNVETYNSVNSFDIATAERWHRNLYLTYNAPSWLKNYAINDYTPANNSEFSLSTRIPPILLFYILDKYLEEDKKEAPFIIPKKFFKDEEASSTMSPRAWTLVANEMISDAIIEWSILDKNKKKKYNSFEKYFYDPNNQINFLLNNIYEFGAGGEDIVRDITSKYVYFYENRILPEDVIYSYKTHREKVAKIAERKGSILFLLYTIALYINNVNEWENVMIPAVNISTFITDTNIPVEDLSLFIHEISKNKTNVAKELSEKIYSINSTYRNSYKGFYYMSEKELLHDIKEEDKENE
ncbi:MAG: hypothetical protein ACOC1O_00450 [bacterium]